MTNIPEEDWQRAREAVGPGEQLKDTPAPAAPVPAPVRPSRNTWAR